MNNINIFESVQFLNESNDIVLNEKVHGLKALKKVKEKDVPQDFKKLALKMAKYFDENNEHVKGKPISDLSDVFASMKNPIEKIERRAPAAAYQFIVLKFDVSLLQQYMTKKALNFAEDAFTKCGFKKGADNLGNKICSPYYYIEKGKYLYAGFMTSQNGTGLAAQYMITLYCLENTEEMQEEVIG